MLRSSAYALSLAERSGSVTSQAIAGSGSFHSTPIADLSALPLSTPFTITPDVCNSLLKLNDFLMYQGQPLTS